MKSRSSGDLAEFLGKIPLFKELTSQERGVLAERVRKVCAKKGEVLFMQGDEGNCLFIIGSGAVKISISSEEGGEFTIAVLGRGEFFGEMSLLDGLPRSAEAVCLEDTDLYVLGREEFYEFLMGNFHVVKRVLSSLSQRLRATNDIVADTLFLGSLERLAKRILRLIQEQGHPIESKVQHNLELNITQQELANYVGITRESVNKQLRNLKERGILESRGRRLIIKDIEALKELAGNSP
jgi:CRP-like cAMP-binding protein